MAASLATPETATAPGCAAIPSSATVQVTVPTLTPDPPTAATLPGGGVTTGAAPTRALPALAATLVLTLGPSAAEGAADTCFDYSAVPQRTAELAIVGGRGVAVAGDVAYVATWRGLDVVDVSNPSAPHLLARSPVPRAAHALAIHDRHALVAFGEIGRPSGLAIVDISTPSTPTLVGQLDLDAPVLDVVLTADLALLAGGAAGIHIVDISDPLAPETVATVPVTDRAYGVAVAGNHAYVADHAHGLTVVDVSEPSKPRVIADAPGPGLAFRVAVEGDRACIADLAAGLRVFDISDPESPTALATGAGEAYGVAVAGATAYVTGAAAIMTVYDVRTVHPLSRTVLEEGQGRGIAVHRRHAYLVGDDRLQIYRLPDHPTPPAVAAMTMPGPVIDLRLRDAYGFAAISGKGLQALDLTDPARPELLDDRRSDARDLDMWGDIVAVAGGDWGLQFIDTADPAAFQWLGRVYDREAIAVAVHGDYAVYSSNRPLKVVDLTVSPPEVVGRLSGSESLHATEVAARGDLAYFVNPIAGTPDAWLGTVDMTERRYPQLLALLRIADFSRGLVVDDDIAYVGSRAGLHVVDVSDPEAPAAVTRFEPHAEFAPLAATNTILYCHTDEQPGSFRILDVSRPDAPVSLGSLEAAPAAAAADSTRLLLAIGSDVVLVPAQCADGVRPVTLVDFGARPAPGGLLVTWETAGDVAVHAFRLQRSAHDGRGFKVIASLRPAGSRRHQHLDTETRPGVSYDYRLEVLDRAGDVSLFGPVSAAMPARPQLGLGPVRPNPFRADGAWAAIPFELAQGGHARLRVFDASGRLVRELVDARLTAGAHATTWSGRDASGRPRGSGVYFLRLEAGEQTAVARLLLAR